MGKDNEVDINDDYAKRLISYRKYENEKRLNRMKQMDLDNNNENGLEFVGLPIPELMYSRTMFDDRRKFIPVQQYGTRKYDHIYETYLDYLTNNKSK